LVPPSALWAFISAVQGRQFDLTPEAAFEVLSLAQELGVTSREEFTTRFIDTNQVEPPDDRAALDPVLERLASSPGLAAVQIAAGLAQSLQRLSSTLLRAHGDFEDAIR
jgi:hypothetical protein